MGVAALIFVGAYAAKAWGWQRLFSDEQRPAVLTLAAAGGAASVGGIALPGRCDEVIRVAVVRRCRRRTASFGAVVLSLFVLGLIDSAAMTPLAAIALAAVHLGGWLQVLQFPTHKSDTRARFGKRTRHAPGDSQKYLAVPQVHQSRLVTVRRCAQPERRTRSSSSRISSAAPIVIALSATLNAGNSHCR